MLIAEVPAEVRSYSSGVAGDAVPYSIGNDDFMTMLLMGCFIFIFISLAKSKRFITRQLKNLFFTTHNEETPNETSTEMRFQLVMVFIDCLLLGIASYIYATETISHDYLIENNYLIIGQLIATFMGYFLMKWALCYIVHIVFFGSKKNIQWFKSHLFLTACEGVMMLPIIILQVYFNISPEIVLFTIKSLTFYKGWSIFFRQNGGALQNILYFCALEITPMLAYGGLWLMMMNFLKINF